MRNLKPLSISSFHLLTPALSVPLGTGPTHETLPLVTGLSKFQAMFSPCWTSPRMYISLGRFLFHSRIHPTRCLNCQTYGHNISKCQNPRVCENCGKDYSSDNYPKTSPSFCVPCFKSKRSCHDHVTTSSSCPLYRQQVRLKMGLVVNLLLYSILSFLLNLTLLLWRKLGFLKTQTMSQNMTLCLMAFMSCTHTDPLVNEVEVFL